MSYTYKEDVATADIAFEASGKTLEKLFESCGLALTNVMVKDLKTVKAKTKKTVKLEADNTEDLLFNFLQELIFLKDAEQLLFSKISVQIKGNKLIATLQGDKIDPKTQEMLVDVKAVTYHMYKVEKTKTGWKAFVILDI